jgi:hypothetical protein
MPTQMTVATVGILCLLIGLFFGLLLGGTC